MSFEVLPKLSKLPFRERDAFADLWHRFGGDGEDRLLIENDAVDAIRSAVARAAPNETLGFLLGRSFVDRRGEYTVVRLAIEAGGVERSLARVRLDHRASRDAAQAALERGPYLDLVGWWHSHPVPSGYSATDRAEQAGWSAPGHVGLLAFMSGSTWARAYWGPEAEPLRLRPPPAPSLPPPSTSRPSQPCGRSFTEHRATPRAGSRRRVVVAAVGAGALIATAASSVTAVRFGGRVERLEARIDEISQPDGATPSETSMPPRRTLPAAPPALPRVTDTPVGGPPSTFPQGNLR